MKKHGFTLAETLITLAILGVVAAIGIPQIVTMAQKHQSEAIRSKVVYQMELGVQKLISDTNNTQGNFSYVDKLMLINNWQSKLLKYIDASEITDNKTAWNSIFGSPAFAAYDMQATISNDRNIQSAINDRPALQYNGEFNGLEVGKDTNTEALESDKPLTADPVTKDSNLTPIKPAPTSYKMNNLGAEVQFKDINNAKSYNADDIAFKVVIDTNGTKKPDKEGVDQFTYSMKNSGKMVYTGVQN